MPAVAQGQPAPTFTLAGIDSRKYSLGQGLGQAPLLLTFFKVSCPTCQFTLPFVERLYRQFRAQGVHVWGVSQDDLRETERFAKEYDVTFPLLLDEYPYEISREYGLEYVPTLFLVQRDGRVELATDGFSKRDLLEIQKSLSAISSTEPLRLFQPEEKVPEFKPG